MGTRRKLYKFFLVSNLFGKRALVLHFAEDLSCCRQRVAITGQGTPDVENSNISVEFKGENVSARGNMALRFFVAWCRDTGSCRLLQVADPTRVTRTESPLYCTRVCDTGIENDFFHHANFFFSMMGSLHVNIQSAVLRCRSLFRCSFLQHPRCESSMGCVRQPTFGWEGEKARFCSAHKVDGMLDVKVCTLFFLCAARFAL